MRIRILSILALALVGVTTLSLTRGQDRIPPASHPPEATPQASPVPAAPVATNPATRPPQPPPLSSAAKEPARDLSKLGTLQKEMLFSCQRGADWLYRDERNQGPIPVRLSAGPKDRDGGRSLSTAGRRRLRPGSRRALPRRGALRRALHTGHPGSARRHRPRFRPSRRAGIRPCPRRSSTASAPRACSSWPSTSCRPRSPTCWRSPSNCATGFAVRPAPTARCAATTSRTTTRRKPTTADSVNEYPGLALYAVLRSQKHRPAAWKTEMVRKAAAYYRAWWKDASQPGLRSGADSGLGRGLRADKGAGLRRVRLRNERLAVRPAVRSDRPAPPALVRWVHELGGRQGGGCRADHRLGGVRREPGGGVPGGREPAPIWRVISATPRAWSAVCSFYVRLQYTDANTQHFAEWYRPRLVGGFHASTQDGNLRIDYTQHALSALVAYLEDAGVRRFRRASRGVRSADAPGRVLTN